MIFTPHKTLLERFPNRALATEIKMGRITPSCIYTVADRLTLSFAFEDSTEELLHLFRVSWTRGAVHLKPVVYTHQTSDLNRFNSLPVKNKNAFNWLTEVLEISDKYDVKQIPDRPPSAGVRIETLPLPDLIELHQTFSE